MKKAIALAAVAGLAGAASAQFTINISANVTTANPSDVIVWTVSVTGSFGGADYVQGYDLNLIASDAGLGTAGTFTNNLNPVVGATAGTPAGASLLGASGGQSSILGVPVLGPIVIGTFTVHADNAGFLSYSISDGGKLALTNVLQIKPGSDFAPDTWNGLPNVSSDTVEITPTPASAALLGLGGLVATRRRR
ncbi:MAG: MYXO-CTERM sorting domain-containing protein [Phycisphaerales bacterium]